MIQQDPLMPKADVARTLKCSERTLERLVRAGGFPPPLRHGKEVLWFESVVHRWLQRQRDAQLAWTPVDPQLYQPEIPRTPGARVAVAVADPIEGFVPPPQLPPAKRQAPTQPSRREARAVS